MCRVLGVSGSGYHAWRKRPPSPRARENASLEAQIKAAHERTRQTYGTERLQADLADHGIRAGVHRIKRIRGKLGLRCMQKRKFGVTTDPWHNLPVAPNLLARRFAVDAPNKAWVTDITCVSTVEGWPYPAGFKDLLDGELVGCAMAGRMTQQLVMQALFRAVVARRAGAGWSITRIAGAKVNSIDRRLFLPIATSCREVLRRPVDSGQYCAHACQKLLRQFGMQPSMSRKGDCRDNAPMESCWGSLKTGHIHHRRFATREQAKHEIAEYIEIFHSRTRKQARPCYLSPAAFRQRYQARPMAA